MCVFCLFHAIAHGPDVLKHHNRHPRTPSSSNAILTNLRGESGAAFNEETTPTIELQTQTYPLNRKRRLWPMCSAYNYRMLGAAAAAAAKHTAASNSFAVCFQTPPNVDIGNPAEFTHRGSADRKPLPYKEEQQHTHERR